MYVRTIFVIMTLTDTLLCPNIMLSIVFETKLMLHIIFAPKIVLRTIFGPKFRAKMVLLSTIFFGPKIGLKTL